MRAQRRWLAGFLTLALAAILVSFAGPSPAAPSTNVQPATSATTVPVTATTDPPVYAYFYQWFVRNSWNRAKKDFPLAGKYNSDDPHVLRSQVSEARQAGINGFFTSWKNTPTLNRRLSLLLTIARPEHFDVGVVYEALDFQRHPLPIATVQSSMQFLISNWKTQLQSLYFKKPVIIWTGTDQYSPAQVRSVHDSLHGQAILLSAAKQVTAYQRIAPYVDGEAYYWSSADPRAPSTTSKTDQFAAAVRKNHQIWIAPATPGFDGTTLAHSRVVPRSDGDTLVRSLNIAYNSKPDAVGVISWNEWSENTYIEPGRLYGSRELDVLHDYLATVRGSRHLQAPAIASSHRRDWSGLQAAAVLTALSLIGICLLILRGGRLRGTRKRPPDGRDPSGAMSVPEQHTASSPR